MLLFFLVLLGFIILIYTPRFIKKLLINKKKKDLQNKLENLTNDSEYQSILKKYNITPMDWSGNKEYDFKNIPLTKEWYITINGEKKGAYTFEEFIKLDIYDDSLVWKAGWDDWKKASQVKELSGIVIKTPPPLPNDRKIHERNIELNKSIKTGSIKFIKIIGVVLGALVSTAFFAAMSDMRGGYTLGIFGYLIFGVWAFGIYLIVQILKSDGNNRQ
jgi:hypothetical protein